MSRENNFARSRSPTPPGAWPDGPTPASSRRKRGLGAPPTGPQTVRAAFWWEVARVTAELRRVARTDRHRPAVDLLRTFPRVGPITAMTFRLEVPDPGRFRDDRQVGRMLGLAPQVRASGERRRSGRILKSVNPRARTVLVEAVWRWVAADGLAGGRYRALVRNTGSGKKAIVGTAWRLGILLWRLSARNEAYRPPAC